MTALRNTTKRLTLQRTDTGVPTYAFCEPELSDDLKDAANWNPEFLRDCPASQSLRPQTGDAVTVRVENRRTAQSHAFLLRYGQSGVHTLANDFALESATAHRL